MELQCSFLLTLDCMYKGADKSLARPGRR